jgi:ubiquinone/menaquinone biosynthesis C-methylase UbiE
MPTPDTAKAAAEFDRWAEAGRDVSMARGHRPQTEAAVADWVMGPDAVVLDVGCGNGWAVRMLAAAGASRGIGIDASPGMIANAKAASVGDQQLEFHVSPGDALPVPDGSVSHVLSVESLYYYPDPAAALREWARVARPGAQLAIVIDLYRENPGTHTWIDALAVDVHLFGADELAALAEAAGWRSVRWRQVPLDHEPLPARADFEPSRYWPSWEMLKAYREAGSLVLTGAR